MDRDLGIRRSLQLLLLMSAGFLVGLALVMLFHVPVLAQTPAQQSATAGRVFASDAGMVLNFIKPDKTGDFEAVVARLKEALANSDKPERRQQAHGWKIFKAVEPAANGQVLYVFTIDPAVKGADYSVSAILAEAFPSDVQSLYKQYAESYGGGQNVVNLTLVAALGNPPTTASR